MRERLTAALMRIARPETCLFVALWLVLMVGGRSKLFRDPGTFWHTQFGRQMLDSGALVRDDPYSYTARELDADLHWFPHQWLGECIMAALHGLAGWDALLLATVTILAALYTWLAHRLIRAGLHWVLAIALTALTMAAGASHFHIRSHLSTMVFFALTFAWLCDLDMGRTSIRRLFWLVPLYVLWINLHGGILGAAATMILALAGWIVFRFLGMPSPIQRWQDAGLFSILLVVCGLTSFVNPYGVELPKVWLRIMNAPRLGEVILEHRPLDPTKSDGQIVLMLAAVYLAMLLGVRSWRDLHVTWLLPVVWLYLGCTRIRHASLFSFTACLAVADIFPHTRWADALLRRGSDLFLPPTPINTATPRRFDPLPFVVPVLLVLTTLVVQMRGETVPVIGRNWVLLDPTLWPDERMAATLRSYPTGTRVFNEMNFGGFIMYFAPNLRIFVDDRCELYGERFLLDYEAADREPERIEAWRKHYDFELALVQTGSPLDTYMRDPRHGWKVVEKCEAGTLYQKANTSRQPREASRRVHPAGPDRRGQAPVARHHECAGISRSTFFASAFGGLWLRRMSTLAA